jgi:protein-disulfide isomerase
MKFNPLQTPAFALGRRQFVQGGLIAAAVVGLGGPAALAQQTVDTEKLLAGHEVPDLVLGNPDAKVTIVEFASLSCPHCAAFHTEALPKLKEKYIDTGKVRLVMRDHPLNDPAFAGSLLARCADDNDKKVRLMMVLYERQRYWLGSPDILGRLFEIAKQAGFNQQKFEACLSDQAKYEKLLKQRNRSADEFNVRGTPSFFINGTRFQGDFTDPEAFAKVIDPLLKEAS